MSPAEMAFSHSVLDFHHFFMSSSGLRRNENGRKIAAVDWFYKLWVVPVAAVTWFGAAILLCFFFLPLGLLALWVAVVLFEGLLTYRRSEQTGSRHQHHSAE
jgi:hypothetical protein